MEMKEVVSSNISHVGYNETTQTLTVRFRAGGLYEFEQVPQDVYNALLSAKSVGAYFAANIRNKYVTRKSLA